MKHKLLLTTFMTLLLLSCAQENELSQNNDQALSDLKVIGDHVSIESTESLTSLLQKMSTMSRKELDQWEAENNFVSLRSIYNKAVDEENKYFDRLEALGEENLKKGDIKPHADYILENAKYFKFDEEGWFELNIAHQNMAPILNKDGIIVIGGQARKYTLQSLFVAESGNTDGLARLESSKSLPSGVKEYKLSRLRKEHNENNRLVTGNFQVNTCTGTAGRYRVILYEDVVTTFIGSGTFSLDHKFKVKSFRRTVFGWTRSFATSALGATVYFQASWAFGGRTIQAVDTRDEIGHTFVSNYQYSETNVPEIYNSQGEGWGRDGCNCTYNGLY